MLRIAWADRGVARSPSRENTLGIGIGIGEADIRFVVPVTVWSVLCNSPTISGIDRGVLWAIWALDGHGSDTHFPQGGVSQAIFKDLNAHEGRPLKVTCHRRKLGIRLRPTRKTGALLLPLAGVHPSH
jgi:hypothetical protein